MDTLNADVSLGNVVGFVCDITSTKENERTNVGNNLYFTDKKEEELHINRNMYVRM